MLSLGTCLLALTRTYIPTELRLEASDTSFATLSSLKLPGIRTSRAPERESSLVAAVCAPAAVAAAVPSVDCAPLVVPQRFLVSGECVADLWRRIVEKRLTKDVLCLKLLNQK